MLLSGDCLVFGRPTDGDVVVLAGDRALASVIGAPPAGVIAQAAARVKGTVLVEEKRAAHVAAALPRWRGEGAAIHTWVKPTAPPAGPADTRPLRPDDPLDHLSEDLRREIEDARTWTQVFVACADGVAAAFCYASSQTETLWDVSIDTCDAHRRRGLARAAFLHTAALFARAGKAPVWGALDSNTPSLRLAAALGFAPVDRLVVFSRMDTASAPTHT